MSTNQYTPLFELTRGETVESIHFGAIAVANAAGKILAWHGDPNSIAYLRSTAKPFQALPFIEAGGQEAFDLSPQEIALICASHAGTDEHVEVLLRLHAKVGVDEDHLLCGVHPPYHQPTAEAMKARGEEPTPGRHNCSGKHTGMLAYAKMNDWPLEDYVNPSHPVQEIILKTFAEMTNLEPEMVAVGTDGCSAPNFAAPLGNVAAAYARLVEPGSLSPKRAAACRTITAAMAAHPDMVSGPGRFDTRLMEAANGKLIAKAGAEGYHGISLFPGAFGADSPGLGIAVKIADGDPKSRARPAVVLEVLRQLNALSEGELEELSEFGPTIPVKNWRKLLVGEGHPCFTLQTRQPKSESAPASHLAGKSS